MDELIFIVLWLGVGAVCAHRAYLHEKNRVLGVCDYAIISFFVLMGGITFLALVVYHIVEFGNKKGCEERGCDRDAEIRCRLLDPDTGEYLYYDFCREHASKNGFCYSCGVFWGDIDDFEFRGLCPHCGNEIKTELGEYDNDRYVECYGI